MGRKHQDITDLQCELLAGQHSVHVVALMYRETYYAQTVDSLCRLDLPTHYVERNGGVGSLSYAMNRGFERAEAAGAEFVWFVTDVVFDRVVPFRLVGEMVMNSKLAALHPAHPSDHDHHRPDGSVSVKLVPYVEFTAPLWRAKAFRECGTLDENHWYFYQDLLVSREARLRGWDLGVHHGAEVGHTYHRSDAVKERVTENRYAMRKYRDPVEQKLLEKRFGPAWRDELWTKL